MTSANVFNLNSVKQGQVLNANAAKGRSKDENPDAAALLLRNWLNDDWE